MKSYYPISMRGCHQRRDKKRCWKELQLSQHLPEWNKEFAMFAKKLKNVESRSQKLVDLEHRELFKQMLRGTIKSDLCIVSTFHVFGCFWHTDTRPVF